jgi:uncharacterized integral membrane protein (TIGR00698 family)
MMVRLLKEYYPGLLVCALISVIALLLHSVPIWPFTLHSGQHLFESMTLAILLGIITNHKIASQAKYEKGVSFSSKYLLYASIVFLGAKLNLSSIAHLSWKTLCIIVFCLIFSFLATQLIGRVMRLSKNESHLIALGTAICGSSAIAAISPVIKAQKKETVIAVAAINLFGTLAIFLFPVIGHYLRMTDAHFAIWSGTSIQVVPQVVAASFAYSDQAGVLGTTVKLVRVLFLAPMLFILLKTSHSKQSPSLPLHKAVPPFVGLFFLVAILFSIPLGSSTFLNNFVVETKALFSSLSDYLMILAMAAIGMQVSISDFSKPALKPIFLSGISFVILALFSLFLIWVF